MSTFSRVRYPNAPILMVDDEPANNAVVRGFLKKAGYANLIETTDPIAVMALFSEHRPALVILDLLMPRLDGFAVLEALRAATVDQVPVPVLILTADVTKRARCLDLSDGYEGALEFEPKPIEDARVFVNRVGNLLDIRMMRLEQAARQADGR